MAIIASDSGGGRDFEPIPEGQYAAVCDMMVDLGMQDGGSFGPKHKVYIRFQVPEHRITFEKDGEEKDLPAVVGVTFTLSLSAKSNLRPFLEGWRGKKFTAEEVRGFDITKVAGAPAYLNIVHEEGEGKHKGKTFANIASIMPIPKGIAKPTVEGEVIVYDDDNDTYEMLPEWLQKKIDDQIEEEASTTARGRQPVPAGELDDDPFDDDSDVPF
jgi:hypothetical protein